MSAELRPIESVFFTIAVRDRDEGGSAVGAALDGDLAFRVAGLGFLGVALRQELERRGGAGVEGIEFDLHLLQLLQHDVEERRQEEDRRQKKKKKKKKKTDRRKKMSQGRRKKEEGRREGFRLLARFYEEIIGSPNRVPTSVKPARIGTPSAYVVMPTIRVKMLSCVRKSCARIAPLSSTLIEEESTLMIDG